MALLKMEKDGLITLPCARGAKPCSYRASPEYEALMREPTLLIPPVDLRTRTIALVTHPHDSRLGNAYVEHHHYRGHKPLPGAQLRYVVRRATGKAHLQMTGWRVGCRFLDRSDRFSLACCYENRG